MDTEEALLAAIYRNPYDLTLRLAYADWLDEFRPSKERNPCYHCWEKGTVIVPLTTSRDGMILSSTKRDCSICGGVGSLPIPHNPRAELIRLQAVSQTQGLSPNRRECELIVRLARELEDYPCPVCSIRDEDCEEHCPLSGQSRQLLNVKWSDNLLIYPLEAKWGFMDSVSISNLNLVWNPTKSHPTHWAQEVVKRTAVTRFKPNRQNMYPGRMLGHPRISEQSKSNTSFFWCREIYAREVFPERPIRYGVPDPIFDRLNQCREMVYPSILLHAFYATADEAIDDLATAIGTTVREMTYGDGK